MKLDQLRSLAEIEKAGSIQRAAHALNVSQPALSKSIRDLERRLGVSLLIRSASGATLTPYGAILVKRFRGIQRELDVALEELELLKGKLAVRLIVGISPPATAGSFTRILTSFRERHGAVALDITEMRPAQILDAVRDGIVDVGIVHRYEDRCEAGLHYHTLRTYDTVLAIGGRAPAAGNDPDELWSRDWITGDLGDHSGGYLSVLSRSIGREAPARIIRCTSISLYFELAEQSGLVSHWAGAISPYLDHKFRAGALTRLDPGFALPQMTIAAVCKDEDLLSPAAAILLRMLQSVTP